MRVYVGHPTFDLIWYSLCSAMRDDLLESTKQSCYNKKNEQLTRKLRFGIRVRWRTEDTGVNSWIGQSNSTLPLKRWLSPSLKQVQKEFKNDLRRHLGKDISLLKSRFDGGDIDFLPDYLLAKPDGFDGIVFAARSKLRRWRSCKNQSARIVLVDSYVHSAWTGMVVIRFLNTDGNTNFVNEGDDGQEFAATNSQGNDLTFHGGSGCLGLKFGRLKDGTYGN